jgi:hypothetical protein
VGKKCDEKTKWRMTFHYQESRRGMQLTSSLQCVGRILIHDGRALLGDFFQDALRPLDVTARVAGFRQPDRKSMT